MDLAEVLAWIIDRGREWSRSEREAHRPHSEPIPEGFARLFEPEILDRARYRVVPRIENPTWRDQALAMLPPGALADPIDFTTMAGITHDDTILVSRALLPPPEDMPELFFHELVHVVQYTLLGVDEFVRQYVHGLAAAGFRYRGNPLEEDAYALQARFTANPDARWSVRQEVEQQLRGRS